MIPFPAQAKACGYKDNFYHKESERARIKATAAEQ